MSHFKTILLLVIAASSPIFGEDVPVLNEAQGPVIDYSTASMCPFDCKPELCRPVTCPTGIQSQWDGCRCCKTCPRGQGDMCDYQHPCSETLNCVYFDGTGSRGICRSNKTCRLASGKVLQDGETFQPHCSMQCSCQGGLVGCSSLCQSDDRSMAFAMKATCQRIRVPNSCCPQWVCDHASPSMLSALFFRKRVMEPEVAQMQELPPPNIWPPTTSEIMITTTNAYAQNEEVERNEEPNDKVDVEYVAPLIMLHQQQQGKASKMRSIDSSAPTMEPADLDRSLNCTGTPVTLRSCSLNKCGLRLTDDFIMSRDLTCPANQMPTFTYCMFRPCTKKRRQDPCKPSSTPLADVEVKVRHSGCRPKAVLVKYCKSCKSTTNRCCYPTGHSLIAYKQSCYDGSVRTFYVAQATACSCRSDVFRLRDCQLFYQRMLDATLPPQAKVYQKEERDRNE